VDETDWMDGWMNEWMDGWKDIATQVSKQNILLLNACCVSQDLFKNIKTSQAIFKEYYLIQCC
jgi:hypothetical protein